MGYAHYLLSDGREAGYGVEATCDRDGCDAKIDRGFGYLCGPNPIGHKDADEIGCGDYFCPAHQNNHDCPAPQCSWELESTEFCSLVEGHDLPHRDYDGKASQ